MPAAQQPRRGLCVIFIFTWAVTSARGPAESSLGVALPGDNNY